MQQQGFRFRPCRNMENTFGYAGNLEPVNKMQIWVQITGIYGFVWPVWRGLSGEIGPDAQAGAPLMMALILSPSAGARLEKMVGPVGLEPTTKRL